jgi:parvulin-like peptidyl-prolyl isomerase
VRTRLILLLAGLALGCGGDDAGRAVVAELGDVQLTRAELDASLASALRDGPSAGQGLEGADRDRVCSRLLDSVLDEMLLAQEARRRGVTVSEKDVVAYLGDVPPGAPVSDPDGARRHIASRKLQDALLRAMGPPSLAEVESLASRMRTEAAVAGMSAVLRALRLGSVEEAREIARQVQAGETTFEREASARDPGAAAPLQVSLAHLPTEVGAAVSGLAPGQITTPVTLHAGVYLFELVSRDAQGTPAGDLRTEARQELIRRRGEMAVRALLVQLRRDRPLALHRDRLGFRYVEDGE